MDVFGHIVVVTHAASCKGILDLNIENGDEYVGMLDEDSVQQSNYAVSIITPASTVYRGFIHYNTVPVENVWKCDVPKGLEYAPASTVGS
jgi:hypothetical protein